MIPRPPEVHLHRWLQRLSPGKYLLGVSGGMDSMALMMTFQQVAPKLKVQWAVAHIHHGVAPESRVTLARDRALQLVQTYCAQHHIEFVSRKAPVESLLSSEAEFREFRYRALEECLEQTVSRYVVVAHHRDDLLETRIQRLIRGTGPQGLVGMRGLSGHRVRPFLRFYKHELHSYVIQRQKELPEWKLQWIEDPSNETNDYLRNWLRNEWLPALEVQRPGSILRLEQSLNSLVQSQRTLRSLDFCFEHGRILRSEFILLPLVEKRRLLGAYLQQNQVKNFGLSHLNEIAKRLDVEQIDLKFKVLKKIWLANARHIWCESENKLE